MRSEYAFPEHFPATQDGQHRYARSTPVATQNLCATWGPKHSGVINRLRARCVIVHLLG